MDSTRSRPSRSSAGIVVCPRRISRDIESFKELSSRARPSSLSSILFWNRPPNFAQSAFFVLYRNVLPGGGAHSVAGASIVKRTALWSDPRSGRTCQSTTLYQLARHQRQVQGRFPAQVCPEEGAGSGGVEQGESVALHPVDQFAGPRDRGECGSHQVWCSLKSPTTIVGRRIDWPASSL